MGLASRSIPSNVILTAFIGQVYLLLPFAEPCTVRVCFIVDTVWTADAPNISVTFFVSITDRHPAGVTLIIGARLQVVVNSDPIIKDKAFPLPQRFFRGDILKIFQDAAFKVIDLLKSSGL